MNQMIVSILAFLGGVFLAIQGGFNAQLSANLKNPILASFVASFFSVFFALFGVFLSLKKIPSLEQVKVIPHYLWFSGALFSVLGISLYYYTIPKLGISSMISLGLCGQIIFSVIAGHFGLFNLPIEPVDYKKIIGVVAMIAGILLINNK